MEFWQFPLYICLEIDHEEEAHQYVRIIIIPDIMQTKEKLPIL